MTTRRPIETAPKDGTLVVLWIDLTQDETRAIEAEHDGATLSRTIGHNNFKHDGEDRWQFAGWNWNQDCYTEGYGTPVFWAPLPE